MLVLGTAFFIIEMIPLTPVISYDIETPKKAETPRRLNSIFAFSLGNENGNTSVHRLDGSPLRVYSSERVLNTIWDNDHRHIAKTAHNLRFDLGLTEKHLSRKLRDHVVHDTMAMSFVLQNHHPSHALDDLSWELAGFSKAIDKQVSAYTKGGKSFQTVPEPLFDQYQHNDGFRGMLLFNFFYPMLVELGLLEVYEVERDLIPVTIDMENRGVMINKENTTKLISKLENDMENVLLKIEKYAGRRVKPGTHDYLDFIFKEMKFPILNDDKGKPRIGKSGRPTFDKEVIADLRLSNPHELLELTAEFRSWEHGISTLTSYKDLADSDDVLHPNLRTFGAITGRQACTNPNLHNVEKTGVLLNPYPVPARTCFRPRPGFINFHLDYSGQEFRLLIHYSGDQILVDVCNRGGDVHDPAARIFYGSRYINSTDTVIKKMLRDASKNGNFSIGYGAAFPKVAVVLGIPQNEAQTVRNNYKNTFPLLVGLMPTIIRQVSNEGKVYNAFGRPIHVPRDQAYIGTNYLIQGTAADMLKRGQIKVHHFLEKATSNEMQILMCIHDELIIECPRTRLQEAKNYILPEVCRLMTDFGNRFKVPMGVEIKVATYDWEHKHFFMNYESGKGVTKQ